MKTLVGKIETREVPIDKVVLLFRTTDWRPVSFFGEELVKRKACRVYEGRGGFPSSSVSSSKQGGAPLSHC